MRLLRLSSCDRQTRVSVSACVSDPLENPSNTFTLGQDPHTHAHLSHARPLPNPPTYNLERACTHHTHALPTNREQALAYALARLPGCYAASERIFRELAVRFPALQPRSLLDFGAGPGTATWAAQEVWVGCAFGCCLCAHASNHRAVNWRAAKKGSGRRDWQHKM